VETGSTTTASATKSVHKQLIVLGLRRVAPKATYTLTYNPHRRPFMAAIGRTPPCVAPDAADKPRR
jgi:hypothetical protein